MLSSDKGEIGAADGQFGMEWPPSNDNREGGEGTTAPQRSLDPVPVCPPEPLFPAPLSPAPPTGQLEMRNLELIHHFTTATYVTLSTDDDTREMWRLVIPRIAVSHQFVMHGLLAISALHLSFLRPTDKSYAVAAAGHHGKALGSLRTTFSQHGDALYAASSLNAIYMYASLSVVENVLLKTPTWIPVFKGIVTIIERYWREVCVGELTPLMSWKPVDPRHYAGEDIEFPISLFDLLRRGAPGAPDPEELEDDNVLVVYQDATEELKYSWDLFWSTEPRVSPAFRWSCAVSDEFVRFIEEYRPRALVLLAYHCVLLELLEDQYWWIKGRGADEIKRIEGVLEGKWKRWLDWPMARCKIRKGTV